MAAIADTTARAAERRVCVAAENALATACADCFALPLEPDGVVAW